MSPSTLGAIAAFVNNYMTMLANFANIFRCMYANAAEAVRARRPTLETVKTIISVSLDLIRTALAVVAAAQEWEPSTA